jgi:hypothetical protein
MTDSRQCVQEGSRVNSARSRAWIAALLAVLAFPFLFPGHTPFINDEPLLLQQASDLNAHGQLARAGLPGSQGRRYGPLPLWIYQALVAVTHDPIKVMCIHVALMSGAIVGGLVWLSKSLRLWRWGVVALAMSPYVWFYDRLLWDNNFNIALGTIAVAAYASFLARPQGRGRGWVLGLALSVAGMMLLVHLMAAPLVVAMVAHLLVARRRDAREHWLAVVTAAGAVLAAGWAYWPHVFHPVDVTRANLSVEPDGWWFALLGPRVLCGAWIEYLFSADWLRAGGNAWYTAFVLCSDGSSLLVFPVGWFGLLVGLVALVRRAKRAITPVGNLPSELAAMGAIAVVTQIVLNGVTHTYGHPHYYNGTWIVFALLAWVGMDWLSRRRVVNLAPWAFLLLVSALPVLLLIRIIQSGGTRDLRFGATLANQMRVMRQYGAYSEDSPIQLQVQVLPHALRAILALQPPHRSGSEPTKKLVLRYAAAADPTDAHLELVELVEQPP